MSTPDDDHALQAIGDSIVRQREELERDLNRTFTPRDYVDVAKELYNRIVLLAAADKGGVVCVRVGVVVDEPSGLRSLPVDQRRAAVLVAVGAWNELPGSGAPDGGRGAAAAGDTLAESAPTQRAAASDRCPVRPSNHAATLCGARTWGAQRCSECMGAEFAETRAATDREIERMWNAGAPPDEIAARIGITKSSVGDRLVRMRKEGYDLQRRRTLAGPRCPRCTRAVRSEGRLCDRREERQRARTGAGSRSLPWWGQARATARSPRASGSEWRRSGGSFDRCAGRGMSFRVAGWAGASVASPPLGRKRSKCVPALPASKQSSGVETGSSSSPGAAPATPRSPPRSVSRSRRFGTTRTDCERPGTSSRACAAGGGRSDIERSHEEIATLARRERLGDDEIAERLGRSTEAVRYQLEIMRKAGYEIPPAAADGSGRRQLVGLA
jgi:biotin operon repressor